MSPTGGYFGLELEKGNATFHHTPHAYKSGRAALYSILKQVRPSRVYLPFYICGVVLEAFAMAEIPFVYYALNGDWEPASLPVLSEREYFLYVDYLGIKTAAADALSQHYGERLIVDCTQAFFVVGNGISWYFNSCRKFFGVPDGSFLYAPAGTELPVLAERNEAYLLEHLVQRFNGHVREGYTAFLTNEALCGGKPAGMSKLSEYLLSHLDYGAIIKKRRHNFQFLSAFFDDINQGRFHLSNDAVPMVYPLLCSRPVDKGIFHKQNLFIPGFWPDVLEREPGNFAWEKQITRLLLPLPIDHRCNEGDLERMAAAILKIFVTHPA